MNVLNSTLKTLSCGLAALALTAVMSWSLVDSTSAAPFAPTASSTRMAKLTVQRHVWFGQSQPAVLVD
jgi:hypothetical protein